MNAVRHLPFPLTDGSQLFDVDNFLADLERLAAQPLAPESFYQQLLESSSLAVGAKTAAYWMRSTGQLRPAYRYHPDRSAAQADSFVKQKIDEVFRTDIPRTIVDRGSGRVVLACPVRGAMGVAGVLMHALSPEVEAASVGQLLELAAAVAEIAGDFELRRQVVASGDATRRLANLESFLLRVYRAESVEDVARELAEEGRRLVGCDRLSVFVRSGRSWHVAAVSGVDSPSHRSAAIRGMERLVRVVATTGDTLVLSDEPVDHLPPQIQRAVDDYFDDSAPRYLVVAPCVPPVNEGETVPRPDVAVVLEQFQGVLPDDCLAPLRTVSNHAAVAISRAQRLGGWPLAHWMRSSSPTAAGRGTRRALIWGAVFVALCWSAAALALIPASLQVSAEGRFVVAARTRVFAPMDAVVNRVLVKHGAKVTAGQPLIELRSPQLELEIEQVEGQLATTRKEISALEMARLRATLPSEKSETDVSSLAAKLAALRELANSHERRLELLKAEALRLLVVSPIDGEVLSWKPEDYLQDRPVERGQRLLEIANTEGGWEIELEVPDRRAGHVLAADSTDPLHATYVVMSAPAVQHSGRVKNIATATQPDDSGHPVMCVAVEPEDAPRAAPRSGMMVVAKIHCGEHALGYVWFHEAWEALQRYWF